MAYTYDSIFAVDPANPANVAKNASITIFDPADAAQAPIAITDPTGVPLPNPMTLDAAGMGPAYQHPTLARVGWKGAGFVGYFTSYEGMFNETQAAKTAAESAVSQAQAAANTTVTAASVNSSGRLILTKADASTVDAGVVVGGVGPKGDKGTDGSNVLPTQQAIEQAITTEGPARAALNTTFGRKSAANVDAYTKSKNMPTGAVAAMSETGQAIRTFGNGSSFVVSDGVITNTHTAANNGSAYLQTQIEGSEKVRRMFAVVNAPANNGSSLALVFPAAEWRKDGTGPLGPAGIHYVVDPNGNWHVGYWTGSAEETFTSGTSGAWKDGTDRYVEVTVDVAASSCTITHPDGTSSTVTDARISPNISGWGIIESYVFSGTAPSFAIKDFGIAAKAPSAAEPFVGKATYLAGIAGLKTSHVAVTTEGTYVATTTAAEVAAGVTQISFTAPPSGKATLRVEAFVQITDAAAHYIWGLAEVTGSTTSSDASGRSLRRVAIGARHDMLSATFNITGMVPGKTAILGLRHMSTVASAATLKVGGTNAFPFNITVTPYG